MKYISKIIFFLFLYSFCLPSISPAKPLVQDMQKMDQVRYEVALKELLKRVDSMVKYFSGQINSSVGAMRRGSMRNFTSKMGIDQHRAILFKNVTHSFKLTAQGGALFFKNNENLGPSIQILKQAINSFQENAVARLIYADLLMSQGQTKEAGSQYIKFWEVISHPDRLGLNQKLFKANDAPIISSHVIEKLKSLGLSAPEEKELISRLSPNSFRNRLTNSLETLFTFGLPLLVLLAVPFFLGRKMLAWKSSIPFEQLLQNIYGMIFICYLLWLAHVYLGLPTFMNPVEAELLTILIVGILMALSFYKLTLYMRKREESQDPDVIFCPKCKRATTRIVLMCPHCNYDLKK